MEFSRKSELRDISKTLCLQPHYTQITMIMTYRVYLYGLSPLDYKCNFLAKIVFFFFFFFFFSIFWDCWVQTFESRTPLKRVLGGVRDVAFSRNSQTVSAVFQLCRFTVFPKDPIFSLFNLFYKMFGNIGHFWQLLLYLVKILNFCKKMWAATLQNQQSDRAPSEDSDQPGHLPSLIRVFAAVLMDS